MNALTILAAVIRPALAILLIACLVALIREGMEVGKARRLEREQEHEHDCRCRACDEDAQVRADEQNYNRAEDEALWRDEDGR